MKRMVVCFAILALCMVGAAGNSAAQTYPTKPIHLIVAVAPGGATDYMARLISPKLAERLKQQIIVDNHPGASTIIGSNLVVKAAPDGYTLLMVSNTHAINVSLLPNLPYDPERDFTPVSLVGTSPFMLVVHPSLPARSIRELVQLAKARPGQLNYASSGNGSGPHLCAELFNDMAGVKTVHVPYKGAGPALIDVLGGHIDMMFASALVTQPHVKANKLRALAMTGARRTQAFGDLPTVAEGGVPGYESSTWYGIFGPAKLPSTVTSVLSAEIARVISSPDMNERITASGVEPVGSTPQAFAAHLKDEIAKWKRVIERANIRAD